MPNKPKPKSLAGNLSATNLRVGIVISRFNSFITERLLDGALDALNRSGAADDQIEIVRVPGSFELPVAAKKLAESQASGRHHLHRLRPTRRNLALRTRLERSSPRHPTRPNGHRRPHRLLRPNLRHARASHRSRRPKIRQQRFRSRPSRSRNGKSLPPTPPRNASSPTHVQIQAPPKAPLE